MIREKELVNEYNVTPLAGNAAWMNSLFDFLFNPLVTFLSDFISQSIFYISVNKSSFGKIFFMELTQFATAGCR